VLAVAGVAVCEWSLRAHHHHVTINDDAVLWALVRQRATGDRVAVIGTSRIQLAFSSHAFEAATGLEPANLAIDGVPAVPILEDLAADPRFRGLVLCDFAEWELSLDETGGRAWAEQAHRLWRLPGAAANRWLANIAQGHLVALDVGGRWVLASAFAEHAWPSPAWLLTMPYRDRRGDYRNQPPARLEVRRQNNRSHVPSTAPSPDAWLAQTERLDRATDAIRARGGQVVFVRMPITGQAGALADAAFPRAAYWDRFAARTHGLAIHANDVPAWRDLVAPDEYHLDRRDQDRFVDGLVAALRERGALP
jgi:hypothetical protein